MECSKNNLVLNSRLAEQLLIPRSLAVAEWQTMRLVTIPPIQFSLFLLASPFLTQPTVEHRGGLDRFRRVAVRIAAPKTLVSRSFIVSRRVEFYVRHEPPDDG